MQGPCKWIFNFHLGNILSLLVELFVLKLLPKHMSHPHCFVGAYRAKNGQL